MVIDVMDLNFKTINIPEGYDPSRMTRAKRIAYSENVKILNVEKIDEKNIVVTSRVKGGYNEQYDVELTLLEDEIKNYSCTCEDYHNRFYM